MDDHTIADLAMDDGAYRSDRAVVPDAHVGSDHSVGADDAARADRYPRSDDGPRINRHPGAQHRRGVDGGARHDAIGLERGARPQPVAMEFTRHGYEGA